MGTTGDIAVGVYLIADAAAVLWWIDVIVKVTLGLCAVIFVHELGHFLVAKACGVKCEKFFIGFDIGGWKLSHKWGETEYGIGILPLGGYVKMLGQDDDPAHIAEQMQKSQIDAKNPNAVSILGPDGKEYYVDRRSYLAKSVPQRMAIISAGVVMNIIFAFIFSVIAYGMGVSYMPCIVSETIPGSPAWQADIEPGDEIVQIGNRVDPTFTQLRGGVTLGDLEHGIPCVIRRAADGKEVEMVLMPAKGRGLATIGIISPRSMELSESVPTFPDSPAAEAKLVDPPAADVAEDQVHLLGGDRIIRVNDQPVDDYRELEAILAREPDKPLLVTVERREKKKGQGPKPRSVTKELTFEVPGRFGRRLGLVMQMGPITAVQDRSPAVEAGLAVGDLIVEVDGKAMATAEGPDSWDALSLPEYMRKAAVEGRQVELTVDRPAADGEQPEQLTITVAPRVPTQYSSALPEDCPMGVPALGIAYRIDSRVEAVWPGSPAAAAGIRPGDLVTSVDAEFPEDIPGNLQLERLQLDGEESNWPALFDLVQQAPTGTKIELSIQRGEESLDVTLKPVTVETQFVAERGFGLRPLERVRRADSLAAQVQLGWDETADALTMVYRFLQKIGSQQVPLTAMGGPVTIAKAAGYSASEGLAQLLVFLTVLSANLAVLNFLPIPLLDGGHMVFLAWEGIRGRPASEKFVVALHTAGFVFLVSLMLFVIALDFGLINRNL